MKPKSQAQGWRGFAREGGCGLMLKLEVEVEGKREGLVRDKCL